MTKYCFCLLDDENKSCFKWYYPPTFAQNLILICANSACSQQRPPQRPPNGPPQRPPHRSIASGSAPGVEHEEWILSVHPLRLTLRSCRLQSLGPPDVPLRTPGRLRDGAQTQDSCRSAVTECLKSTVDRRALVIPENYFFFWGGGLTDITKLADIWPKNNFLPTQGGFS